MGAHCCAVDRPVVGGRSHSHMRCIVCFCVAAVFVIAWFLRDWTVV